MRLPYRIKRISIQDHIIYIPQQRVYWWWEDISDDGIIIYFNIDEAQEYILKLISPLIKIIE